MGFTKDEQIFHLPKYLLSSWSFTETKPVYYPLQWRHNGHDSVSSHQPCDCLLNDLFNRKSKKTSKLGVTGLCVGNSPETGEFPAQMASNAENVSILWRHHAKITNVSYASCDLSAHCFAIINHD